MNQGFYDNNKKINIDPDYLNFRTPTIISERSKTRITNKVILKGHEMDRETVNSVIQFHTLEMGKNLEMTKAITILDERFYR
ncbi:MAG: hypothetical protein Q7S33_04280 [Nanoarchaeota archaeon]|nr:hypothetical protein [Nanoarchaeota archaeon]